MRVLHRNSHVLVHSLTVGSHDLVYRQVVTHSVSPSGNNDEIQACINPYLYSRLKSSELTSL